MTAWDDLLPLVERNAVDEIVKRIGELSAADRKQIAGELPRHLRSLREDWQRSSTQAAALTVIGAGCLTGAEAVATWIARSDLADWRSPAKVLVVEAVCELTAERPVEWRADLGRRLSAKLRRTGRSSWDPTLWEIAAALIEQSEAAVPEDDAFLLGWLRNRGMQWTRSVDYFFAALVPRMFEVEGVGESLAWESADQEISWLRRLLVHADRTVLLDGCVSRFLRGGRDQDQRWFLRLHAALDPTLEESAARLRDYVRLLPTAGKQVAETALNQIVRVDKDISLPADLFAETAEAVLFRTDKKLVRTALIWMDRTARSHDRIDATVGAVSTVFDQEALDLQERAVKLAIKYADQAGPETARTLRDAASVLPHDLRERVAAAYGAVEAVAAMGPVPLFNPAVSPLQPISSSAALIEEFSAFFSDRTPLQAERLLPALLAFGPASRDALTRVVQARCPWILEGVAHFDLDPILVALLTSSTPRRRRLMTNDIPHPRPAMVFPSRVQEAAAGLGDRHILLATPTLASGHVDPEVLVARMHVLEAAGVQPGRLDLQQALLRLPRSAGPVAEADSLKSPAGKTVHDWLTGGGMADPVVVSEEEELLFLDRHGRWRRDPSVHRLAFTVTSESGLSIIRFLCDVPEPSPTTPPAWWRGAVTPIGWDGGADWPLVLPSHREVIAAYLCRHLPSWTDSYPGQGAVMLALAEAEGPTGTATATALAYALSAKHPDERAAATDALVLFAARDSLPHQHLAEVIPALLDFEQIKLNRLVETFTTALHSGVNLWPLYRAVLPALLPAPGTRPRAALADLLALINASAETFGTRDPLPALAGRTGSSRLASEATRLHRTLSQQH
jgi:hypothetical protein